MTRFMTRACISHQSRCLIGLVTLVYSVLFVMAAGCALAHADWSQSHHREHGSSAHNVLCAWACQATADTAVAIGPPSTVADLVVAFSDLVSNPPLLSISSAAVHSRAPPSHPFVRLE